MSYFTNILASIVLVVACNGCMNVQDQNAIEYCNNTVKMETPPLGSQGGGAQRKAYNECISRQITIDIVSIDGLRAALSAAKDKVIYVSIEGSEAYNLVSPNVICDEFDSKNSVVVGLYPQTDGSRREMMRFVGSHNAFVANENPKLHCKSI